MDVRPSVHPAQEPQAALQQILQTAVAARRLFPRGGFEGLEANTLQVLLALHLHGERTVGDLVDQLLLGQGTVSTALARLQGRELVTERVSESDRRRRVQAITGEGNHLVGRFLQQCELG